MLKVKLLDVQKARDSLKKIFETSLPIKTSFVLGRVVKEVDKVYEEIEQCRVKLVEKYGEESEGKIAVKQENIGSFQKEFLELLTEQDVELNIEPMKLDLIEDVKLTPAEATFLTVFFEE